MAAVIHALWERQDSSLMILPANVPIDEPPVQFELTRYMEDPWVPVIEKDVDGSTSLPLRLDRENPNLGRYSACRRVARTLYLGSAPTLHTAHKGIEDRRVKLGCVQPGESVATFGDALRRLTDSATHLYVDGKRYWFSTQPSVLRTAQERAERLDEDVVHEELRTRLRKEAASRGDFDRVHACPASGTDIPDARETRLVIIGPDTTHTARSADTPARKAAEALLTQRGTSPRLYRNTLVFLAPDKTRLAELDSAVRQYLAWKSIEDDRETLNLDGFQTRQATTRRESAEDAIKGRIPETYHWLLVPTQPDPKGPVEWEEIRLQGSDTLAVRASKKLRNDALLVTKYGGTVLKIALDGIPLWRGDHVSIKQLAEDFAQYLYLPRLKNTDVLLSAVSDGLSLLTWADETFAYAEGLDAKTGRYQGLRGGQQVHVTAEGPDLLVKSDVASRQLAADRKRLDPVPNPDDPIKPPGGGSGGGGGTIGGGNGGIDGGTDGGGGPVVTVAQPVRFHGSIDLDVLRLGRDAGQVAQEIVQHLSSLVGSRVKVTLEIEAEVPDGVPAPVVRTVSENCQTLRFQSHGFEDS